MKTKQRRSDSHGLVEYNHATITADLWRQNSVVVTVMVSVEYKQATITADLWRQNSVVVTVMVW